MKKRKISRTEITVLLIIIALALALTSFFLYRRYRPYPLEELLGNRVQLDELWIESEEEDITLTGRDLSREDREAVAKILNPSRWRRNPFFSVLESDRRYHMKLLHEENSGNLFIGFDDGGDGEIAGFSHGGQSRLIHGNFILDEESTRQLIEEIERILESRQ